MIFEAPEATSNKTPGGFRANFCLSPPTVKPRPQKVAVAKKRGSKSVPLVSWRTPRPKVPLVSLRRTRYLEGIMGRKGRMPFRRLPFRGFSWDGTGNPTSETQVLWVNFHGFRKQQWQKHNVTNHRDGKELKNISKHKNNQHPEINDLFVNLAIILSNSSDIDPPQNHESRAPQISKISIFLTHESSDPYTSLHPTWN